MKILQITRQFYPSIGGIETVIWHLTQNLQKKGHQVDVLALDRPFNAKQNKLPVFEKVDGISIIRIPFWGFRQYAIAPRALQYLAKYDIIHLHSADFFLDYLAWTKIFHHKPIILSTHGLYFHTPFAKGIKKIYFNTFTRFNLINVPAIVCVSTQDMELVKQIAPIQKIHLIPNGIDYETLSRFNSNERNPDLLVSVGRLAENKRYDRLLHTFSYILKERTSAKLAIIGPDWGEKTRLQQLARKLQIEHSVEFLGSVSNDILWDYLKRARIWVSSTQYESFGVALLEAMAAGCIPVVQPLFSFKQLLSKNYQFFTDFDKPENAANMILSAMNYSSSQYEDIARDIKNLAAKYSWQKISMEFNKLYVDVLTNR